MPVRRTPKIEALVVYAIRRLQDIQGSTSREISNYISQEYDIPGKEIRRHVQLALQRGLSYGILQRSKGGYYSCNRDYFGRLLPGDGTGDGVMEPCPSQPWRFGVQKKRAAKRRRRRRAREARERRAREKRKRERARAKMRRVQRRRRRRDASRRRRRRGRRRSRAGRRRSRAGRRRSRAGRVRTRADPGEMEMEATTLEQRENGVSKDGDSRKSGTSISEHSDEQHLQNSQASNVSDDV